MKIQKERYDVVIVGGGATGLSGAPALARARRPVLVIDAGEPRNAPASHVHNYLGREGIAPSELLAVSREEVSGYGAETVASRVIPRRALVVAPRFTPRGGILAGLGLAATEQEMAGHVIGTRIATDASGATEVPGVRAAGNVADPTETVIDAAAAGPRAGAAVNADPTGEDTRRAVAARRAVSDEHPRAAAPTRPHPQIRARTPTRTQPKETHR